MPVQSLRRRGINARSGMSRTERDEASARICARVVRLPEFLAARTVGCYIATPVEVDTRQIIERAWRAKKRIFAPVIDFKGQMGFREVRRDTCMERNSLGLLEPVDGMPIAPAELDIVVTPVVAFDDQRHRIGMGGGYFDRTFAYLANRQGWLRPKLIGIAFACQRVEKIEPNPWDIPLYRVVTDSV